MNDADFDKLVKFHLNKKLDGERLVEVDPTVYQDLLNYTRELRKRLKNGEVVYRIYDPVIGDFVSSANRRSIWHRKNTARLALEYMSKDIKHRLEIKRFVLTEIED